MILPKAVFRIWGFSIGLTISTTHFFLRNYPAFLTHFLNHAIMSPGASDIADHFYKSGFLKKIPHTIKKSAPEKTCFSFIQSCLFEIGSVTLFDFEFFPTVFVSILFGDTSGLRGDACMLQRASGFI
jgi:hypothetical protein